MLKPQDHITSSSFFFFFFCASVRLFVRNQFQAIIDQHCMCESNIQVRLIGPVSILSPLACNILFSLLKLIPGKQITVPSKLSWLDEKFRLVVLDDLKDFSMKYPSS